MLAFLQGRSIDDLLPFSIEKGRDRCGVEEGDCLYNLANAPL
jgi:hypothetical protein